MKKKMILTAIILSLLFIATGCGQGDSVGEAQIEPSPDTATENANGQEDDFMTVVQPIYDDLSGHIGERVTVEGFVLIREAYEPNEFMVARLFVDCCFDDAAPMGFVASWDGGVPAADEWVRVTGVVSQRELADPDSGVVYIQPSMTAESVEIIEPYESMHVFAD